MVQNRKCLGILHENMTKDGEQALYSCNEDYARYVKRPRRWNQVRWSNEIEKFLDFNWMTKDRKIRIVQKEGKHLLKTVSSSGLKVVVDHYNAMRYIYIYITFHKNYYQDITFNKLLWIGISKKIS